MKKAVVVVLLGLAITVCAWLLFRRHENPLPSRKEGQKLYMDIQKRGLVTGHAGAGQGGRESTVAIGPSPRLTVSRITTSGPTQNLPDQSARNSKCPFRKHNVSGADVKLPPLPGVTGNERRVYLESPWGAPIIWNNTQANAAARLQKGPFNIGLIVTVLGQSYASFLQRLITSADKYFMNGQNVTYFMFTDDLSLGRSIKTKRRIVATEVKDKGWPCNALLRFGSISEHRKQFASMHFLFSLDVDVYLEDMVGTEILENLVGTLHVGYYLSPRASYTYDNNPLSTAYINKSEGEYYFAGAFFGGCRNAIIQMAEMIERNVKKDLKEHHYIALWHDESHLNRYFIDNLPTKILSPEYLSTPYHKIQRRRIVQIEKGNKVNKTNVGWQKCW